MAKLFIIHCKQQWLELDMIKNSENQILQFMALQQTYYTDIIWRTIATRNSDGPAYDKHFIFSCHT